MPAPSAPFPAHSATPLVKICGLTRAEDVQVCIDAGADAIGFNFWPKSKRCVTWAQALPLLDMVPAHISRVAVLVNAGSREVHHLIESARIDCLQFHGDESLDYFREFANCPIPLIRAAAVRTAADVSALAVWPVDALLLDAYAPGTYGGTGHPCDWPLAAEAVRAHAPKPILVSGGLTPENVAEALRTTGCAGADVASGVESAPGIKDPEKIRAFIRAAKGASA